MSQITPQELETFFQGYTSLNGLEKAQFIMTTVMGRQLGDKWLEMIKTAIVEYIAWHNQQHPNFQTCEHCDFIKDNATMYNVMKYWLEQFHNITPEK